MTTTVSVKGQVVIPKSIRQGLGKDWADRLFGKYRDVDLIHDLEETRRREKEREAAATASLHRAKLVSGDPEMRAVKEIPLLWLA